jgi:hypothetical protein
MGSAPISVDVYVAPMRPFTGRTSQAPGCREAGLRPARPALATGDMTSSPARIGPGR